MTAGIETFLGVGQLGTLVYIAWRMGGFEERVASLETEVFGGENTGR